MSPSTKRIAASAVAAACLLAAGAAGRAAAPGRQVRTVRGELVDVRCHLISDKRGAEHAKCAAICAKDGLPVGILTEEGRLYTLIVQPSAFADSMALQVEVTGTVSGDAIVPDSARALREGTWVEIKLPEQMM